MRMVGNINIPCGCEARKDIMFTQGQLGLPEAILLAGSALLLVAAFHYGRAHIT